METKIIVISIIAAILFTVLLTVLIKFAVKRYSDKSLKTTKMIYLKSTITRLRICTAK